MSGAAQGAAGHGLERENVTGLDEVVGAGCGIGQQADAEGAVGRGDAGADVLGGIDRDREGGAMALAVAAGHLGEFELFGAFGGDGRADQAAAVNGHEGNRGGAAKRGGGDEVGLVFAAWVIDDDDDAAGGDFSDDFIDGAELEGLAHEAWGPSAFRAARSRGGIGGIGALHWHGSGFKVGGMLTSRGEARFIRPRGFSLVVTVNVLVLLMVLALAMMTLAVVELRKGAGGEAALARANARLALQLALGDLQKHLGPDQRISAPGVLADEDTGRHRTAVWSALAKDGEPWVRRDDEGGWTDVRAGEGPEPVAWLDSGRGGAEVEVVGAGSVLGDGNRVKVSLVDVTGAGSGRMAWWVDDLGCKAELSLLAGKAGDAAAEAREMLVSQGSKVNEWDAAGVDDAVRSRLASSGTADLVAAGDFMRRHFHDHWWSTHGVLADVRRGGLKRDLTPYLEGEEEGSATLASKAVGIADDEPLFADVGELGKREGLPTFGLLKSWARAESGLEEGEVDAVVPPSDGSRRDGAGRALCNDLPARLRRRGDAGLQPVLVEATNYMQLSVYRDRTEGVRPVFQVRTHNYPRVVLWNPYSVDLVMEPVIVMIQGNGRQEVWTENLMYSTSGAETNLKTTGQWLFFEGGRSTAFTAPGGIMNSEGYNDPYMGSYYYSIPRTKFGPGDCLVFSPAKSAEYDGLSAYRPGRYDLAANVLSCEVAPDPSRSYYVSASEISGGIRYRPVSFWYAVTPAWSSMGRNGVENQGEDTRVVVKALTATGAVTYEEFDRLPLVQYVSASLQYGAGREPRIAWFDQNRMPIELLDKARPRPTLAPEVRTRDGVRLRWFDEHPSNLLGSGGLAGSPQHFDEALLANWNPRAAYAVRSPWENIAGSLPGRGSAGGPWFFGAYTRDLYDEAVSWDAQVPVFRDGRYHGNPFGLPQEGDDGYVLFDVPRDGVGVMSIGQFQHARISEFVWHPSFAVGNSLADPRLGMEGLVTTLPRDLPEPEEKLGGFHFDAIGWSADTQRSSGRDEWAATGRALLQGLPQEEPVVYDLSFEVNQGLWDGYFLSTGDAAAKRKWLESPVASPLPNKRMRVHGGAVAVDDVHDVHRAAGHLRVAGAFNVNSTSVVAWQALLGSLAGPDGEGAVFLRHLGLEQGAAADGDDEQAWRGHRQLSDAELKRLAEAIVTEVKARGPFVSLADFVNRRLRADETGRMGAVQAAIERAGINDAFRERYPLANGESLGDYRHPDGIRDATRIEQRLKPDSKAWGAASYLTQADVLQGIGPVISARSDSFLIRAYGESRDVTGKVRARAWCEAEVARVPEPVVADASGLEPAKAGRPGDFGRKFEVISFRWLRPEDV